MGFGAFSKKAYSEGRGAGQKKRKTSTRGGAVTTNRGNGPGGFAQPKQPIRGMKPTGKPKGGPLVGRLASRLTEMQKNAQSISQLPKASKSQMATNPGYRQRKRALFFAKQNARLAGKKKG